MRIGILARQLGTTAHAIRFYEQRGLLPAPVRSGNGYREYGQTDAERLRLLIGLRQLDIPLDDAAQLATMCAAGRCDEVSEELRVLLVEKRAELVRRIDEMRYLGSAHGGSGRRARGPHCPANVDHPKEGGRACPCAVMTAAARSTAAAAAPSRRDEVGERSPASRCQAGTGR